MLFIMLEISNPCQSLAMPERPRRTYAVFPRYR